MILKQPKIRVLYMPNYQHISGINRANTRFTDMKNMTCSACKQIYEDKNNNKRCCKTLLKDMKDS